MHAESLGWSSHKPKKQHGSAFADAFHNQLNDFEENNGMRIWILSLDPSI